MPFKINFDSVLRVVGILFGLALVAIGIFAMIKDFTSLKSNLKSQGESGLKIFLAELQVFIIAVFMILFGLLTLIAESRIQLILARKFISFLLNNCGRGVFYCFTGFQCFLMLGSPITNGVTITVFIMGLLMILLGIVNIIYGCIFGRGKPQHEQMSNDDPEVGESFVQSSEQTSSQPPLNNGGITRLGPSYGSSASTTSPGIHDVPTAYVAPAPSPEVTGTIIGLSNSNPPKYSAEYLAIFGPKDS